MQINVLQRYAPGLTAWRGYEKSWLRHDLVAGVSVAAVALPTGIAYAGLAGFSPETGIYASTFPLLAYFLFGSSRQLITGPDAATCALIAASLGPLAAGDPDKYLAYSVVLSLITGLLCIIGGLARLGFIANFLSKPILTGFLNGVAINIIVGQLGKLFGFSISSHDLLEAIPEFITKFGQTHSDTLYLSLGLLTLAIALKLLAPRTPGPLIVAVSGILAVAVLSLDQAGVSVLGAVPAGLPTPHLPSIDPADLDTLFRDATGIVLVAFTSAMLTARSFSAKNRYDIDVNQEFIALGACNLAAGFGQGFAVSGADSRTAVSDSSGGRSRFTGLAAALVMLLVMLFLTAPLADLPVAALGVVLVVSAAGLLDIKSLRRMFQVSRAEFALSLIATVGVITVGALPGIILVVVLSLLRILAMASRPHDAVLGRINGVRGFHDVNDYAEVKLVPGVTIYRFDSVLVFFNVDYFKSRLNEVLKQGGGSIQCIILDASPINFADLTAVDKLEEIHAELAEQGVELLVVRAKRLLRDKLEQAGVQEKIGRQRFYPTIKAALRDHQRKLRKARKARLKLATDRGSALEQVEQSLGQASMAPIAGDPEDGR
jgi:high affinity sulfate transporter 1